MQNDEKTKASEVALLIICVGIIAAYMAGLFR